MQYENKTPAESGRLDQIAAYWDTRSHGYELQVEEEISRGEEEIYLRRFGTLREGMRVLDIGCGPGFFSVMLAKAGCDVTAIDCSEHMIAHTLERAQKAGVTVSASLGDAQAPAFENGSFDLICSRNLVWNLENPRRAYAEWLRCLKPGGRLFVYDGNHYRYMFDKDYARLHEDWEKKSNHIMLGVDSTPIDNIARELPMGAQSRPDWDLSTLTELGYENVQTQILSYFDAEMTLINAFLVTASRPL